MGAVTIGCDHGCFHNNKHGTDSRCFDENTNDINYGCSEGYENIVNKDIKYKTLQRCLEQIKNSDILIATINKDKDCFGTIAEISYAYSLKKYIIVLFDDMTDKTNKELWFICKMAMEQPLPKYIVDIIFEIEIVKHKFNNYQEYKNYIYDNVFDEKRI